MVVLCEICHRKEASVVCRKCGRLVCQEHQINGLCLICHQSICMICGENLAIGYCVLCGRLGCDNCLVQIDNVRRVCVDCLRKYGGLDGARRVASSMRRVVKPRIPWGF